MAVSDSVIPIPGAKTVDQIRENAKTFEFPPLSKEILKKINELFLRILF